MAKNGLLSNYALLITGVLFVALKEALTGLSGPYVWIAGLALLAEAGGMVQKGYVSLKTLKKLLTPQGIGTAIAFGASILFGLKMLSNAVTIPGMEQVKMAWMLAVGLFLIIIAAFEFEG